MRYLIILTLLIIAGCRSKTADVKGYLKYCSDMENGLVQQKEIDGLMVEVKYLSPEKMALNEIKSLTIDEARFEKVLNEYKGFTYFNVSVKSKDDGHIYQLLHGEGIDEYGTEAYLNYKAQNDFYLITNGDTAKCVLYNYTQTYGLAKQFDIALGFENRDTINKHDRVLEFDADKFNRGLMKFVIKSTDISNVPTLTL